MTLEIQPQHFTQMIHGRCSVSLVTKEPIAGKCQRTRSVRIHALESCDGVTLLTRSERKADQLVEAKFCRVDPSCHCLRLLKSVKVAE